MRVIGFDVGTKKVGVAVGQFVTKTANPLPRLKCEAPGQVSEQQLRAIIKEWRPEYLLVGLPKKMDDQAQFTTALAEDFIKRLEELFPQLSVCAVDERLSTKEAKQIIFDRYGYQGLKSKDMDGFAACLLIEQWMQHDEDK